MPPKKKVNQEATPHRATKAGRLEARVLQLELDMHSMRTKMDDLGEDLSALRTTVKHVDERTLRGEAVMLSMQLSQRRVERVLDAVAEKLQVSLSPVDRREVDPPEPPDEDADLDARHK